jgi:hypothetical protein
MPSLNQIDRQAANLYWLAFLLTGNRQASVDATVDALDSQDANPFFLGWMLAWARKVVIAKALAAIRQELVDSAKRIALARNCGAALLPRPALPRHWSLAPGADRRDLEQALLAMDAFPRCVLLLLIFEKLSEDDVVVLLDADRELVRKAQALAVVELTRNLAGAREAAHA